MKLKIDLDNLDDAIQKLEALSNKIREFPHEVATESSQRIGYSGTVVEPGNSKNRIVAKGEGYVFQEFGAGFEAQVTTIDIDGTPTESYPGVYSEDHGRTFQEHSGRPEDYPFNITPKMTMQNEAKRLEAETEDKARRYFGN